MLIKRSDALGSQVQLFAELGFKGAMQAFDESVAFLPEGFHPKSCKVLAGR